MIPVLRHYIPAVLVAALAFIISGPRDVPAAYFGKALGVAFIMAIIAGTAGLIGTVYAANDMRTKRAQQWAIAAIWIAMGLAVLGALGARFAAQADS